MVRFLVVCAALAATTFAATSTLGQTAGWTEITAASASECWTTASAILPAFQYAVNGNLFNDNTNTNPVCDNSNVNGDDTDNMKNCVAYGNSIAASNCAVGGTALYSNRIWAIGRDGTGHCYQGSGSWMDLRQKNDPFTQRFRFVVTRKLWACRYDSSPDMTGSIAGTGSSQVRVTVGGNTFGATSDPQFAQFDNGANAVHVTQYNSNTGTNVQDAWNVRASQVAYQNAAQSRIAYKAEQWQLYKADWNSGYTSMNHWCFGACSANTAADSDVDWTNPTDGGGLQGAGRGDITFMAGACAAQSGLTCQRAGNNAALTCTGSPPTTGTRASGTIGYKTEQIACATSAALLAQSKVTSYARSNNVDPSIGLVDDFFGTGGLITTIINNAAVMPSISSWAGQTVAGPALDITKTFWLDDKNKLDVVFSSPSNQDYVYTGYADTTFKNTVQYGTSPATIAGNVAKPVSFDGVATQTYRPNDGSFTATGGAFVLGQQYWATVTSLYDFSFTFSCQDRIATSQFPYRYDCSTTYQSAMGSGYPASTHMYNGNENTYPIIPRQFSYTGAIAAPYTGNVVDAPRSLCSSWSQTSWSVTSDPIYVGYFQSATNRVYKTPAPRVAEDGVPEEEDVAQIALQNNQYNQVELDLLQPYLPVNHTLNANNLTMDGLNNAISNYQKSVANSNLASANQVQMQANMAALNATQVQARTAASQLTAQTAHFAAMERIAADKVQKEHDASKDYNKHVALLAAGVVVFGVLLSVAVCIAAAVHAKLSG